MDMRLFQAAETGNINLLHHLLAQSSSILHTVALTSNENPLHIASTAGHVEFVKEMVRLKPSFAKEVNQDGFSPIHLASAIGHLEIVKELLKVDQELCRLEGRNQWTALHYAASRGRVDIIREMLLACPESIEDVNVHKETALHLAVKNSQFKAIHFMINWITGMKKDEILNMKDELGNSILHLATWRKHRQVIEWVLGNTAANARDGFVNAVNQSGLTALDILLIFPSEAGDREIEDILRHAGGRRANDTAHPAVPVTVADNRTAVNDGWRISNFFSGDLVKYFKFRRGRDSPSDARTALLVIAVLVATATFQAGLNPPGGVWQETDLTGPPNKPAHLAGRSIMGSYSSAAYLLIMVPNCIGFSVSLFVISILISNFPLEWEFQVCICALYFTYNTAITFMAPKSLKAFLIAFSSALPGAMPLVIRLVRLFLRTIRKRLF
ncbi:ankyrin repeat-containing protein BDA1-like [Ziziphus jujuba]|uniref:Ankyrin repeat-containing protein BDA1-like n=1 Tax=Ziziphus jujuba TaxID=326968 RepID=A0ABM3IEJ3_ZIZJJ|nr:ankyrin repeat-containing protein BDA1-like [Ziziphus jujuba]